MTEIRCPNCGSTNPVSVPQCMQCSMPFSNLPSSAFVVSDADNMHRVGPGVYESRPVYSQLNGSTTGENTFFWYRMYCGSLALLYASLAVFGGFMAYLQPDTREYSSNETMIIGLMYALGGAVFFVVFLVATLLPAKPYNWIVGVIMIGIGMTSCFMWPAVIPLLIYWIKPETRSFFGRN